ncbi:MAG: YIP1 family protein [Vicinamibacterales bacterium]|nr:hypothetical protein [Acidobacteriota bacterium]
MATLRDRMIGAARLQTSVYEEVEADQGATGQAMAIVVLASLAGGVGMSTGGTGLLAFVNLTLASLVGWFVWAVLTYVLGTRMFAEPQTNASVGELLRTTGFAAAPGLLRVFGIVPGFGWLVYFVTAIWMLATMVVAVRQALDYRSTGRAVGVCLVGWFISLALAALIGFASGPTVQ